MVLETGREENRHELYYAGTQRSQSCATLEYLLNQFKNDLG